MRNGRRLLVGLLALSLVACSGAYETSTTVVSGEYTQKIWVTGPDADDSDDWGSWPLVFAWHGLGGTGDGLSTLAEKLASNGVVVFAPTYRTTRIEQLEQDAECAYRYALSIAADHGADLDQPITFVGESLGATVALYGGLNEAAYGPEGTYDQCGSGVPRPDVIVPVAGCHFEYDGVESPFDITPFSKQDALITLVVGSDDEVCAPWQSKDAEAALLAAGYDVEYVEIEGGNHNNVAFYEVIDDEWVQLEEDPIGDEVVQAVLDAMEEAG